VKKVPNSTT